MPKLVVCGTLRYLSRMSLASALMRISSTLRAFDTASASPESCASRRCSYASPGNLESMGRSTGSPSSTGSLTANSTRSFEPGLVAMFFSYCPGAKISERMASSCTSPKMPRVFTLPSTRLRSPTPAAMLCMSPNPRYTASSCSLTCLNEDESRSLSVRESFSSTVIRICSSWRALSLQMLASCASTD